VTAALDRGRSSRANLLLRSVLTSGAFVLAAVPAVALAGGYVPQLRPVANFGRLLVTDLPWLVLGASIALLLALVAVRLGGRRFTALLAVLAFVTVAAGVNVGVQYATLAAEHGAAYDILRQARAAGAPTRGPDERIVFAEVEGEELHAEIWHAAPPAGVVEATPRPGILFVHGGAFTHGSPGLRPHLFGLLAERGFAVVDIEYRLSPPPRWQEAPADVLCALGWFQRNAPSYGVDPARIVVMGDSAGGNLALVASYGAGSEARDGGLAPSCNEAIEAPARVIAIYPTADLTATWADVRELSADTPFPEIYVGGPPSTFPDRYEAASVQHYIRAGIPTTLLITGANDSLVRVERIRALESQLRAAGTDVELVVVPFADHAFDGPVNGFGMQLEETLIPAFVAGTPP